MTKFKYDILSDFQTLWTGFEHQWFANNSLWYHNPEVLDMPVPSSYNDIPTNASVRDFVGWAWYFRTFYVPQSWYEKVSKSRKYEVARFPIRISLPYLRVSEHYIMSIQNLLGHSVCI